MRDTDAISPQAYARACGWLYLVTMVGGIFALFVGSKLLVLGDASATAKNILTSEQLFRFGLAGNLIADLSYVAVTVLLYLLLKPVNRNISLLAAFFSLAGCAVGASDAVAHLAALELVKGADYLKAIGPAELQALARFALRVDAYATEVGLVFFGVYCILIGYLIFGSGYLPKIIGAFLMVGGLCYEINSFMGFLAPAVKVPMTVLAISGIAELSLCLWLIVMGVNVAKWRPNPATS